MKESKHFFSAFLIFSFFTVYGTGLTLRYPWLEQNRSGQSLMERLPAPDGYHRIQVKNGSFADWLRHLPLKKEHAPVRLYDGTLKPRQDVHFAVVNLDVGGRDLQQCADAVIRLRAEYLFSIRALSGIRFRFSSGHMADYRQWAAGYRPRISGQSVTWIPSAAPDQSYDNFRRYLNTVFIYAGSHSLERQLSRVPDIGDMRIGDVFIQGGFPGHAVMVLDMAEDKQQGHKVFLLGQSYMPAQDFHILRNPGNPEWSPWYPLDFGERLVTPEWEFGAGDLRRFESPSANRNQ